MSRRIRIAFANLQSGIGTTRGYWHYLFTAWKYSLPHGSEPIERAARALRGEDVDIAALCEIEAGSRRTRDVDQVALFADAAGFRERAFFPALTVGSRILQGNAICTSLPLRKVGSHPLPGTGEPRFLNEAEITLDGARVRFFVTHLSLQLEARGSQIRRIADIVDRSHHPLILAGDFNISRRKELRLLAESRLQQVVSLATFPSWRPRRHLDHLFFSDDFHVLRSFTHDRPRFSDHLPFLADVELRGPA